MEDIRRVFSNSGSSFENILCRPSKGIFHLHSFVVSFLLTMLFMLLHLQCISSFYDSILYSFTNQFYSHSFSHWSTINTFLSFLLIFFLNFFMGFKFLWLCVNVVVFQSSLCCCSYFEFKRLKRETSYWVESNLVLFLLEFVGWLAVHLLRSFGVVFFFFLF